MDKDLGKLYEAEKERRKRQPDAPPEDRSERLERLRQEFEAERKRHPPPPVARPAPPTPIDDMMSLVPPGERLPLLGWIAAELFIIGLLTGLFLPRLLRWIFF